MPNGPNLTAGAKGVPGSSNGQQTWSSAVQQKGQTLRHSDSEAGPSTTLPTDQAGPSQSDLADRGAGCITRGRRVEPGVVDAVDALPAVAERADEAFAPPPR